MNFGENIINTRELNLFVFAGEASGDLYGGEIIKLINSKAEKQNLKANIWGVGGLKIQEHKNFDLIQDSSNMGIMGLAGILKKSLFFINLFNKLKKQILERKPDIALLIDYPGFNLKLASFIKKNLPSCKIIFFVAPQVWLWNEKRKYKLPDLIDRLLVIFPFEEKIHKEAGTQARYVGNPSAWYLGKYNKLDKQSILDYCGLCQNGENLISIFPGSREREIHMVLPVFLQAILKLSQNKNNNNINFVLVKANNIKLSLIKKYIKKYNIPEDLLQITSGDNNYLFLKISDLVWSPYGTTTLESAFAGTPLVLGYKDNPVYWLLFSLVKKTKNIALPNILADKQIFPEFLQSECTAENFVKITEYLFQNPEYLAEIRQELKLNFEEKFSPEVNPFENVAQEILMLHKVTYMSKLNNINAQKKAERNF